MATYLLIRLVLVLLLVLVGATSFEYGIILSRCRPWRHFVHTAAAASFRAGSYFCRLANENNTQRLLASRRLALMQRHFANTVLEIRSN